MSIAALNWVWTVEGLNPTERLTLLALADYADADWTCFPGQALLVNKVGVSPRTVVRTLQALEDRGLFTRERRTLHNGARTSDGYTLRPQSANLSPDKSSKPKVPTVAGIGEPSVNPSAKAEVDKRARATRIPEPFILTAEMRDQAISEGIPADLIEPETKVFVDYWRGRSGQVATKRDWPATWRNWMRRAAEKRQTAATSQQGRFASRRETPSERVARLREELNRPAVREIAPPLIRLEEIR